MCCHVKKDQVAQILSFPLPSGQEETTFGAVATYIEEIKGFTRVFFVHAQSNQCQTMPTLQIHAFGKAVKNRKGCIVFEKNTVGLRLCD